MNLVISRVLRAGVIASATVVGLGLALFLITGSTGYTALGTPPPGVAELTRFGVTGAFPTSIGGALRGVIALKPFAFIQLGLLLLIVTPVIRVAASVVAFAAEKDRAYVIITLFVLVVLLVSFALGQA